MTQHAVESDRLFVSQTGVVSLEINEDVDIEIATRLFVKSAHDFKLEIKYPNLDRLDASILGDRNYLKTTFVASPEPTTLPPRSSASRSLCETLLGLYANLAYDSIRKCYRVIVQGFVPNKPLFKQNIVKIGNFSCFFFILFNLSDFSLFRVCFLFEF